MDASQMLGIIVVGITAFWFYLNLKQRIDFLEHEVRWLRSEVETLKPTEVKSQFDKR